MRTWVHETVIEPLSTCQNPESIIKNDLATLDKVFSARYDARFRVECRRARCGSIKVRGCGETMTRSSRILGDHCGDHQIASNDVKSRLEGLGKVVSAGNLP